MRASASTAEVDEVAIERLVFALKANADASSLLPALGELERLAVSGVWSMSMLFD